MKLYANTITCPLTGTLKKLVTVNCTDKETTEVEVSVGQLHHIYVLDRSGSMGRDINTLMDNVLKTLDVIHEDDLVTIIWFSSRNQFRTVVKGAKKSNGLNDIINTLRSVVGMTCFSDPIQEVSVVVDELYALCPNISVTLFTDGEAVVPWSDEEEYNKVYAIIEKMKDKIMAFNTIGYGNYYNQEFLKKASAISEYGEMTHSSKIDEYLDIFSRNFKTIEEMVGEGVVISAHNLGITYLSRNFTKAANSEMSFSRLNNKKNQFFILGETTQDFEFSVNGEIYNTLDITKSAEEATIRNFFYASAYNYYYAGNRYESLLTVVKALGEKGLADSHISAFTFDETGKHIDSIRKALFNPKQRLAGGTCTPTYIPDPNAYCIMDMLRDLGSAGALFSPFGLFMPEYQRTTIKAEDTFNLFERDKSLVLCGFDNFTFNEEFLNFSIKVEMKGHVKLNPKQAGKVGLPAKYPAHIFRNYSIIVDGRVNMPVLEAYIPSDNMDEYFLDVECMKYVDSESIDGVLYHHVVIYLEKLPVINKTYVDKGVDIELIFKSVRTLEKLKFSQKVVKEHIKNLELANIGLQNKTSKQSDLSDEQIELLREHGVTKEGAYAPLEIKKESKDSENVDSYKARSLEFSFKGLSSIPPVKSTLDAAAKKVKEGKSLTLAQKMMQDASDVIDLEIGKGTIEEMYRGYLDLLKVFKMEMFQLRVELGTIKLAKILTGDWFAGLTVENDYYVYEKDGMTMLVKPKQATRYFSIA